MRIPSTQRPLQHCSELLSQHCRERLLLLALSPACVDAQVMMCQDSTACATEPLHTACLRRAAHLCRLQDVHG